ncbi:MAG: type VI secretion system lipoprotein TssJ [Aquisalimonadaceae bacterium]
MQAWRSTLIVFGCVVLLAACASSPEPDAVKGQIVVGPHLNPNMEGRPSPVYLRVYQLKDREPFMDASLQDLLMRDTDTLGGALLSRDSFELCPVETSAGDRSDCQGEQMKITLDIYPDVRFLAVMAEFFDVNDPSSQWRAVTELPREGFWDFIRSKSFTISLERSRVDVRFD